MTRILTSLALASSFILATGCNEHPLEPVEYGWETGVGGEGDSGGDAEEDDFDLEESNDSDSGGGDDGFDFTDHLCGNGVVEPGEECDIADSSSIFAEACTPDCKINVCGDGIVYADDEDCDAGDQNGIVGSGCSDECTLVD